MELSLKNTTGSIREAFFESAQESFAIFDQNLTFIDVNTALLNALHVNREQIVGKNLSEISPNIEETKRYKIYQEVLQTGKSVVLDDVQLHPSLGNYTARVTCFKVGEGLGLASLNITDLKDAIDELETYIYKSSHDLRTPLTNMIGLVNLSLYESKENDPAFTYLQMIKEQAEHLDSMLKKLFDTSRIRKGDKIIHKIDFEKLINEIKNSLSYMDGFTSIHFEQELINSKNFYGDKPLLICVFKNIIDNAIKYRNTSCAQSFIRILIKDEIGGIKIKISDNGIGIPEKIQKEVFKMFFRGTSLASGAGLGLYTVKHCIKKLCGHISLMSEENEGSVFTVFVPNEYKD
ncbi:MAG TPA: ATP-binding protein [Cytophaga sp.]|nr:ATP-binding protein [Cytophaga sp.]